jgi:hypothetical protein
MTATRQILTRCGAKVTTRDGRHGGDVRHIVVNRKAGLRPHRTCGCDHRKEERQREREKDGGAHADRGHNGVLLSVSSDGCPVDTDSPVKRLQAMNGLSVAIGRDACQLALGLVLRSSEHPCPPHIEPHE